MCALENPLSWYLSEMDVFVGGRKRLGSRSLVLISWLLGVFYFPSLAWLPRMANNLGMNMVGWKRDRLNDGLDDQSKEVSGHLV